MALYSDALARMIDMRMKKWVWPKNYGGAEWHGYYVFLSRTRDSDILEDSNFAVALAALGGETGFDDDDIAAVAVVREGHWACGWVEWIAIHETAIDKIAIAEKLLERLENYPILDEEDFSEREYEECAEYWGRLMNPHERAEYLRRHSYTCNSFSDMSQAIRGSWYHAANMLHCPSELIAG